MRAGNFLFSLLPRNLARVAKWVSLRGWSLPSDGRQIAGALHKRVLSSATCHSLCSARPKGFFWHLMAPSSCSSKRTGTHTSQYFFASRGCIHKTRTHTKKFKLKKKTTTTEPQKINKTPKKPTELLSLQL